MCLAIPGKVEKTGKEIIVSYGDEKRKINGSLVDCNEGDYVLVQQKLIIAKIPKEEAIKTLELFKK